MSITSVDLMRLFILAIIAGGALLAWRVRVVYGVMLALGGVGLGVGELWQELEELFTIVPAGGGPWSVAVGAVTSVLGVLGLLRHELLPRLRVRRFFARVLGSPRYRCRRALVDDLEAVCEIATREFETDVSTVETVRRWYSKNSDIIWLLEAVQERDGGKASTTITGYFCLLPLTRKAANQVAAETLTGTTIRADDLVKRRGKPAALYVGGVAGLTWRADGIILAHLYESMRRHCKGEIQVFTRPTTKDGLRVARRHRLAPVDPSVRIGELNRTYSCLWSPDR